MSMIMKMEKDYRAIFNQFPLKTINPLSIFQTHAMDATTS